MLVTALSALWIIGFTADDSSNAAALKMGTYLPLIGVLGILFVQALASVAIVRYFLTTARDGFHWWRTLVAPIIGALAMVGACYLLIANRGALSGAGHAFFIEAIPWLVLGTFLTGIAVALYYRAVDAARHSSIGRVVFDAHTAEEVPAGASVAAG